MNVIELEYDDKKWPEFLDSNDHLVFHRPEWKKFVEETFKIEMKYFAIEEDNKIQFIFPVGIIKSGLFGNRLISVPYIEYGGFAGKSKYVDKIVGYIKSNYATK